MLKWDSIKVHSTSAQRESYSQSIGVRGVELYHSHRVSDPQADLTAGLFGSGFPFQPKRYFVGFGVSAETRHDEHVTYCEMILDYPNIALHGAPMLWSTQYNYGVDGALLVFAFKNDDPDDYIREYSAFHDALHDMR